MAPAYHHGDVAHAAAAAARRQIGEHGADAMTMRGVAAEVGVTHAGLYRHYPSRDALLDTVAADWFDELIVATDGIDGGIIGITDFARSYVAAALGSANLYRCAFDAAADPAAASTRAALMRFRDRSATMWAATTGGTGEDLRDGVLQLWGVLHGLIDLYWRGLIRARSTDAAIDYIVAQIPARPTTKDS